MEYDLFELYKIQKEDAKQILETVINEKAQENPSQQFSMKELIILLAGFLAIIYMMMS